MAINERYQSQVRLMLRILPEIARSNKFALKGGTAINMFDRPLPRLSVDIDLCYPFISERTAALNDIKIALTDISDAIRKNIPQINLNQTKASANDYKIFCRTPHAEVKVEVNTTMRGFVFPLRQMQLHDKAQEVFGLFAEMTVLSRAELYGGKICAALDRQHPRDLFDLHLLFQEEGLTREIFEGFLICLLSHNRPVHELLSPNWQNQEKVFTTQFNGMSEMSFDYGDYMTVREKLLNEILHMLTKEDRKFLLSCKAGMPDWSLFTLPRIKELPAVIWKMQNIQTFKKKNPVKHKEQLSRLCSVLSK